MSCRSNFSSEKRRAMIAFATLSLLSSNGVEVVGEEPTL